MTTTCPRCDGTGLYRRLPHNQDHPCSVCAGTGQLDENGSPPCDCAGKAPTFPIGRATLHVQGCPWYAVEKLARLCALWKELAYLRDNLLVCYRLGKQPKDSLLDRISHLKAQLGD